MSKQHITIPVFIPHLGCRHRCIFCNQRIATGSRLVPAPGDIDALVGKYLSRAKKSVSRVELAFFGGSFTGLDPELQKAYLAAAQKHRAGGDIHGIRLSTRPDYISEESLELLSEYGVTTIELGVQSLDDAVLAASHRGHDASCVYTAVRRIRNFNFDLVIQLMPGLPGETRESAIITAEMASRLGPSAARIYPAVVLRGTGMEDLYLSGTYCPLSLDDAVELCKDIYGIFQSRSIPVIRMGLHPLAPGDEHAVIAGPYHPAFGGLVRSRLRREELVERIRFSLSSSMRRAEGMLQLGIPADRAADYIGQNRENLRYCKRLFNFRSVAYTVENITELRVVSF